MTKMPTIDIERISKKEESSLQQIVCDRIEQQKMQMKSLGTSIRIERPKDFALSLSVAVLQFSPRIALNSSQQKAFPILGVFLYHGGMCRFSSLKRLVHTLQTVISSEFLRRCTGHEFACKSFQISWIVNLCFSFSRLFFFFNKDASQFLEIRK